MAHEAAPAIGADEIAHANGLLAALPASCAVTPPSSCSKPTSVAAEFRPVPKLGQALAHHAFGQELRHQQREAIGFGGRRVGVLDDIGLGIAAIGAVCPLRRIEAAGRGDAVEDAEILEHLLRARLDALAARAAERTRPACRSGGRKCPAARDRSPASGRPHPRRKSAPRREIALSSPPPYVQYAHNWRTRHGVKEESAKYTYI